MKIYDENGWLDMPKIYHGRYTYNMIVGGRATGKTYGALMLPITEGIRIMYMRRTQTQADLINKPEFSPFKKIAANLGVEIITKPITKYNSAFYMIKDEEQTLLGYSCALSTISNLRGFDASDVDLLIYDEFIPEKHERPIKNEASAFFNAIETIGRNRELEGRQPLKVFCLANSNDEGNPLFMELDLVSKVEKLKSRGEDIIYTDERRSLALYVLKTSPISERKATTSLYRLTENTEFTGMALNNDFVQDVPSRIRSRPKNSLLPIVTISGVCIYRVKGSRLLHCSTFKCGAPEEYGAGEAELKRFRDKYGLALGSAYLRNMMDFESYKAELLLTQLLNI